MEQTKSTRDRYLGEIRKQKRYILLNNFFGFRALIYTCYENKFLNDQYILCHCF